MSESVGWSSQRRRALERDGYTCKECGALIGGMSGPLPTAHVHHKTPRSEGGTDELSNLMPIAVTLFLAAISSHLFVRTIAESEMTTRVKQFSYAIATAFSCVWMYSGTPHAGFQMPPSAFYVGGGISMVAILLSLYETHKEVFQ